MIGRIVNYVLTASDADQINRRRGDALRCMTAHQESPDGSQLHVGNNAEEGDVFPMVITKVWNETAVNGQVFLDGADCLWATSRTAGNLEPGFWSWPDPPAGEQS